MPLVIRPLARLGGALRRLSIPDLGSDPRSLGENATPREIDLEHGPVMLDCPPNLYTLELHWGLL